MFNSVLFTSISNAIMHKDFSVRISFQGCNYSIQVSPESYKNILLYFILQRTVDCCLELHSCVLSLGELTSIFFIHLNLFLEVHNSKKRVASRPRHFTVEHFFCYIQMAARVRTLL